MLGKVRQKIPFEAFAVDERVSCVAVLRGWVYLISFIFNWKKLKLTVWRVAMRTIPFESLSSQTSLTTFAPCCFARSTIASKSSTANAMSLTPSPCLVICWPNSMSSVLYGETKTKMIWAARKNRHALNRFLWDIQFSMFFDNHLVLSHNMLCIFSVARLETLIGEIFESQSRYIIWCGLFRISNVECQMIERQEFSFVRLEFFDAKVTL